MDSADFQGVRAVERKDPAVARLQLRIDDSRQAERGEQQHEWDDKATAKHSRGLLATTAWKSKRLVFSGREQ